MAKKKNDMTIQHPDLPFTMPPGENEDGTTQAVASADTQMAELRAQIDKMRGDLEVANREKMALMTQAPTVQPQLRPTDVDTKGLPDPVGDPDGYARELSARTRTAIANESYNANVQNEVQGSQQQKLALLWQDFTEANPGYADEGKVRYIAQELAQKAHARGRDPQKYMFMTTETFFGDVKKLYDKTFGAPKTAGVEVEPDDDSSLLEDEGRTAGIPGGGPSSKSAAQPNEDAMAQGKSMFDGLKSWQLKNGFTI